MSKTLGEGLAYFIQNTATLAAKVSTRVYPTSIPQQPVLPLCTYRLMPAGAIDNTLSGVGRIQRMRIEVTFWSNSNKEHEQLSMLLWDAIKNQNGPLGIGPLVQVYNVIGPRSIDDVPTRLNGTQLDIMCLVDMSTTI